MALLRKKLLFLFALVLSLASCESDDNYEAFFGGEITNPTCSYILFCRNNKVIDTLPLDHNNRFFVKFDSLSPGLYSFKNEPDYQYVYFDKNDSLMVNVNARYFDESIVFSGRGNEKNNFMMELFLMNEKDRDRSFYIYDYDLDDFMQSIDSVNTVRTAYYNSEKKRLKWNDDFDFYAKSRVELNYFTKREYYPYIHERRTGKDLRNILPDNFYDFRKKIAFDDTRLTTYSPFMRYVTAMINNIAQQKQQSLIKTSQDINIMKLNIADSVFKNQQVKNQVLNTLAFNYFLEDQNMTDNQRFLERYDKLCTDDSDSNEIMRIGKAVKQLKTGNKLPEIVLVDSYNNQVDINNSIDKKTVIYFWSNCSKSRTELVHNKVNELLKKHPDISFIGINIDEESEWKKTIENYNFDSACQLRASNFRTLKDKWALTKINRTIILNPDGTIKNAFTNLMDSNFSKNLY